MNLRKILGYTGFGLAILGGYLWMVGQVPASLISWGITILIIFRLNKLKKKKTKPVRR